MQGKIRRILSLVLSFGLLFQQIGFAQVAAELNIANYLSRISNNIVQDRFRPLHLRYFSYDNLNDNFKILLDKGDLKNLRAAELETSTKTLLSYFLVGVALPDDVFWVNLRPDSEDQIIDPWLEKTDVGRIMLEADLQLKKDTAVMTSPSTPEGKEYWDKLYKKAAELYGYDNVTIPTLTRPWIVPGEIIVRESKDSAYVYKATLKVMLEQDYLKDSATYNFKDERSKALNEYSSQLIRKLIIPKLTKKVNSSKRYANLRQVYYSLILSRWFKLRFTGKSGTYASLINTRNLTNLTSQEPWTKTTYFKQYQKSFQDGEYNIKEPVYTPTGQVIRSYFSGGINVASSAINTQNGIILPNDNVSKLGDVIGGKAILDPQKINLGTTVASSPISMLLSNDVAAYPSVRKGVAISGNQDVLFKKTTPVVLLVGKPGAGKTIIGQEVAKKLGPTVLHVSMGKFIREHTPYKSPLRPIERKNVYERLTAYLKTKPDISLLLFDNNPYGDDSYEDLLAFLKQPEFKLEKVVEIDVADEVAISRQQSRGRVDSKTFSFEDRLRYYNSDPNGQVPPQLVKLAKEGFVVQKVDNNNDMVSSVDLISGLLKPATLEGCRGLVMRLVPRIKTDLGLAADQFIIDELAQEILEKGLSGLKEEVRNKFSSVNSVSSDDNLLELEACRIFVNRLFMRVYKRLVSSSKDKDIVNKLEFNLEDEIKFAQEITKEGLFEFSRKVNSRVLFTYPESSIEDILRQETKLFIYAEPSIGDPTNFIQASTTWDQDASLVMQESRKKFYSSQISDAIKRYWEEDIQNCKGKVESFNQISGKEDVSVVILVLASRIKALPKRLRELTETMKEGTFEVNIVLADPDNLDIDNKNEIVKEIKELKCPVKLIESKKNTIAINRNLGSSESSGEYIVFLDDDVRLSKQTLPLMVESLKKHPEVGIMQAVTYDGKTGVLDRPKTWFSKYVLSPEVMVTNIAVGMVVATRKEIVKAVPFVPFWPNFGEDVFFGTQVKQLGFYLSFIYADDAFVVHEHVTTESATRGVETIKNSWIHHSLSYYFAPEYYDDLGQIEVTVRINKTNPNDSEKMETFLRLLRSKVKDFLDGQESNFSSESVDILTQNARIVGLDAIVGGVIKFFAENKNAIITFKNDWLGRERFCKKYVLLTDNAVTVSFPEKETYFGIANGFSTKVNSLKDAQIVLYEIYNAMRNNAGPKVKISARGTARSYLVEAMDKIESPKSTLERYYGKGSFSISINSDLGDESLKKIEKISSDVASDVDLSDIFLGVDVGGGSLKLAALVNGNVQIFKKQEGDSYVKTSAGEHERFIEHSIVITISELASKLGWTPEEVKKKIRGIGISWNAPVRKGRLLSKYPSLDDEETQKLMNILEALKSKFKKEVNEDIIVTIKNDGLAGAIGGAFASRRRGHKNIAYFGLGTGLAFGFVNRLGVAMPGLFEIHNMKVFDESSGEFYNVGNMLSVKAFQDLVAKDRHKGARNAQEIIEAVENENSTYADQARKMGITLGKTIQDLKKYWPIEQVYVGGGVVSGKFGEILINTAQHFLSSIRGSEKIEILQVDNEYRGYESAIGVAYDAALTNDNALIGRFLESPIPERRDYYSKDVNVHKEFKKEEGAIVREQRRIEGLIDELFKARDFMPSDLFLKEFYSLLDKLSVVIKARKKFIELGIPVYHSHTNVDDDGTISPEELVKKALENNVTVLYVTGHNRMGGSIKAMEYLKDKDVILEVNPGVEIDAPVLGASGIIHFVVTGPKDEGTILEMNKMGEEIYTKMLKNYQWRREKMLSWSDEIEFDKAWGQIVKENPNGQDGLESIWESLIDALEKRELKERVLSELDALSGDNSNLDKLKYLLRKWFRDVVTYKSMNEVRSEIYNKLDVMGNWTDSLESWPTKENPIWIEKSAGIRRKAMRSFFGLLYSDQEVEIASGAKMMRADDLLSKFKKLGCRATLAHPEYELFVINEIPEERHEEFWSIVQGFIESGILHSIGAGWSRGLREQIAHEVDQLRIKTARDNQSLPLVLNIPDYHGEEEKIKDIRKGIYQIDSDSQGYYVWEDIDAHDVDSYFRDSEFLARPFIEEAEQALKGNDIQNYLTEMMKAYRINPYVVDEMTAVPSLEIYKNDRYGNDVTIASSPVAQKDENNVGGIDFRALPMVIRPMGSFSGLNFKPPQLSQAELRQINIDSEIRQIKNMVQAGITPSGERIKELISACVQKKEINSEIDNLLLCLADIFKLEEENASESSPQLKEALVIVDAQS